MPGEKAVCVLSPNGSDVKGTIHFEEVREFLNVAEKLHVSRLVANNHIECVAFHKVIISLLDPQSVLVDSVSPVNYEVMNYDFNLVSSTF